MTKDTSRVLAVSRMACDLHTVIQEFAKQSDDPVIESAWNDAAADLDAWMQDNLNNGVLKAIEAKEYDAAVPGYLRDERVFQSSYGRR